MKRAILAATCVALLASGCDQSPSPTKAVTGSAQAGRSVAAAMNLRNVAQAVRQFEIHMGRIPTDREGLGALVSAEKLDGSLRDRDRWNGPYLSEGDLLDRHGHLIVYRRTEEGFVLISLGEDGEVGGTGRNADFEHHERL